MEKKRILVVDDDRGNVKLIEQMLEKNGFDVLSAYDGFDGLNLARQALPDLIILDILMPKIDGFNVCRMLKFDEKYKSIPIIMLTMKAQPEDKVIGSEVSADFYMIKPVNREELLSEVDKLLPS